MCYIPAAMQNRWRRLSKHRRRIVQRPLQWQQAFAGMVACIMLYQYALLYWFTICFMAVGCRSRCAKCTSDIQHAAQLYLSWNIHACRISRSYKSWQTHVAHAPVSNLSMILFWSCCYLSAVHSPGSFTFIAWFHGHFCVQCNNFHRLCGQVVFTWMRYGHHGSWVTTDATAVATR